MDKQFPISEAKNKLPALIHGVEHGPAVQLTRHGKPVAVLISIGQYMRLTHRPKNFWTSLNAFRKSADTSTLLSSGNHFSDQRDRSPGRAVDLEK